MPMITFGIVGQFFNDIRRIQSTRDNIKNVVSGIDKVTKKRKIIKGVHFFTHEDIYFHHLIREIAAYYELNRPFDIIIDDFTMKAYIVIDRMYHIREYLRNLEIKRKMSVFKKWTGQLVYEMLLCWCHGFFHNDIKPGNVMTDDDENAHLIDFDIITNINAMEPIYTAGYRAPELYNNVVIKANDLYMNAREYYKDNKMATSYDGYKCEIWSLANTLLSSWRGRNVCQIMSFTDFIMVHKQFKGVSSSDVIQILPYDAHSEHNLRNYFNDYVDDDKDDLIDLFTKMLYLEPDNRISHRDLMVHSFLSDNEDLKNLNFDLMSKMFYQIIKNPTKVKKYFMSKLPEHFSDDLKRLCCAYVIDSISESGDSTIRVFDDYEPHEKIEILSHIINMENLHIK